MFSLDQLIQNHIDGLVAGKDAEIASLNATVAELNDQLMAKNSQIAQLQRQIADLTAQVATLTQTVADRDATIATQAALIDSLNEQIAALNAEIVTLKARIAELEAGGGGTPTPTPPPDPMIELQPIKYQLRKAWFQEDLTEGPVSSWTSRGFPVITAGQTNTAIQPTKLANNGGVQFAKATLQSLTFPNDAEAPWSNRNWVVVARTDQLPTSTTEALIVTINGTPAGNTYRQPMIFFKAGQIWNSCNDGAYKSVVGPVRSGYENWNFTVGSRRGDMLCGSVNGADQPRVLFKGMRQNPAGTLCTMGCASSTLAMVANNAIDCILVLDGELSESQTRWLEGWVAWYRIKDATILPANHPWRNTKPVAADLEMPSLFTHDQAEWDAWKVQKNLIRHSHRGEAQPADYADGYSRVFFTDWDRPDQFPQSDLTGNPNSPWFAPGWLTTLGGSTPPTTIVNNGMPWPDAYVQDTSAMGIRWIYVNGIWHNGAIMGVNNNGSGRRWGPGIYRTRFKFTATKAGVDVPMVAPLPGLFPGPLSWSYGWEHLFYRARNRIEQDYGEYVGVVAGAYAETNLHIHAPRYPMAGQPGVAPGSGQHEEIVGYTTGTATGWPHALNPYDGNWHEQVTKIEPQPGLLITWIDGIEFGRCPTNDGFEAPRYFIGSHLLDRGHGERDLATDETVTMWLDSFEVMYEAGFIEAVPAAFTARPTVTYAGGAYTVAPNVNAGHIEYRWYVDGVPIVPATGATYTTPELSKLRVHVKAKSLVNQPEAWTAETA